ncbi:23S rRNA pseudouridine(2605) synthase RluB [Halalkalibacter hemicellulosilyticus]|uniref:Pseudouridine synthase n=1 Tax=Halalkalibacter hemicellulosilyticusJCM 9152 TaxID=1236971 RepID=W4QC71_9BACI|nr:pseudouridine synthase [Halalkalibacter hemicellulosilyticus]GAE28959.1 ribosomal large subunit pseudouridine synthase B [Halalkalibacter hemicellulosilyticusJCM 9152]
MERLQKVIAQAGITSRRKAEQLIIEGKVRVNGKVVRELGVKVTPNKDEIEVNGVPIDREEPVYYLLYKPSGVISSVSDDKGRKVVTDFIEIEQRVFPIGRLDYDTSGIIILTNDGEFANLLMHPKYHVNKVYVAKVKGIPSKEGLRKLQNGIMLEDGKTAPAKVKMISLDKRKQTSIIRLTIHEGRNRQVRRMFEAIGHPVMKLKREEYSFLNLKGLNPGEVRPLKPIEVKHLREIAVTKPS